MEAVLVGVALLGATGCGTAAMHRPAAMQVEVDPAEEINDEDVRKAFEARPQMRDEVHVAYFALDAERAGAVEGMLRATPGVKSVYRIPSLSVTGQRRWAQGSPWGAPQPLSIKKLRLVAARAHADVLVVADSGGRALREPNGLVAFGVLVLPLAFLPWQDSKVESYLDLFVFDVRNGYLYGHVTSDEQGEVRAIAPWSNEDRRLMDVQWGELVKQSRARLAQLWAEERSQGKLAVGAVGEKAAGAKGTGAFGDGEGAEGAGRAEAP